MLPKSGQHNQTLSSQYLPSAFLLYAADLREGVIEQEGHRKACVSDKMFIRTLKACNPLKWDMVRVRLYHQGALVMASRLCRLDEKRRSGKEDSLQTG